jgi:hypothetical protein
MDFYFDGNDPLTWSGPAEKAKGNVAAINLAHALEAENRTATPGELATLSRYVGWGHSDVLNYAMKNLGLQSLMDEAEWAALRASTLNAHYTDLPVIAAIWRGLERLGAGKLDSLNVLDPSAGIGHFKSMTPAPLRNKANWVEVELDKITASILAALHPESKVFGMGYEQVNLPKGHFDIITSNVPFGPYPVIFDGLPKHLRTSIHDFFFCRSIDLLRPGGVMAFITSRYTLDKKNDLVRKHLAEHCDLLAAVRLPNNAFKANAGTEVVTDILFLRKRFAPNKELPAWAFTEPVLLKHHERDWSDPEYHQVNRYFVENPENILGTQSSSGTMYRGFEYTVIPDDRDLGEAIAAALEASLPEDLLTLEAPQATPYDLGLQAETVETAPVPETARVKAMREIYATARELLQKEADSRVHPSALVQPAPHAEHALRRLCCPLRLPERPGQHPPAQRRAGTPVPEGPRSRGHGDMAQGRYVLEDHRAPGQPGRADRRPQRRPVALPGPPGPRGHPDHRRNHRNQRRRRHPPSGRGRIFLDPETKQWITDDRYLSGNVAAKLEAAEAAAMFDERYQINVEALRLAQPEPLKAEDIYVQLGAGWIPESDIEAFFRDLLECQRITATYVLGTAEWTVKVGYGVPSGVRSNAGQHRGWTWTPSSTTR